MLFCEAGTWLPVAVVALTESFDGAAEVALGSMVFGKTPSADSAAYAKSGKEAESVGAAGCIAAADAGFKVDVSLDEGDVEKFSVAFGALLRAAVPTLSRAKAAMGRFERIDPETTSAGGFEDGAAAVAEPAVSARGGGTPLVVANPESDSWSVGEMPLSAGAKFPGFAAVTAKTYGAAVAPAESEFWPAAAACGAPYSAVDDETADKSSPFCTGPATVCGPKAVAISS